MNAKKALYVFLMLLLLLFSIGCDGDGKPFKYEPKPYKGSTNKLEGTYHVRMSGEEKGLLVPFAGQNEKNTYDNGKIHVTKKDEKTLEMDYTPDLLWDRDPNSSRSRKPFKLDYDPKTGKATGRDDQGYDWEIDFYVRLDPDKEGNEEIVMKRVSRTWENWLGASDKSYGSSDEGVSHPLPKENRNDKKDNKNDKTNKTNKTNNKNQNNKK
ncbi:MAG: hypothetical protein J6Z82_00355 [Schwartzia sp.]|nr:hypothetical protein [Schwartzia sp. (in: firmicutes)]